MSNLQDYLRRSAGQSFDWSTRNCAFWVADWVKEVVGTDPAIDWRANVSLGEKAWLKAILEKGGMLAVASDVLARIGVQETSDPQSGDVICFSYGDRQVMGIAVSHGRIAMKMPDGIQIDSAPVIRAWRLP